MCWQLSAAYYSSCYAYFNFFIAASCYFFCECSKAAPFIWDMASANYYCCWIGFFFRDCIWVYQIRPISAGADGREWKNIFHIIHINTNHTLISQLKTPATPTSTSKIVSKAKVSIFIQICLFRIKFVWGGGQLLREWPRTSSLTLEDLHFYWSLSIFSSICLEFYFYDGSQYPGDWCDRFRSFAFS